MARLFFRALLFAPIVFCTQAGATEFTVLNRENWLAYVPAGKEVDAALGDYVLRNELVSVVIAAPTPDRVAAYGIENVGGCVIDFAPRTGGEDLLQAYWPGAGAATWWPSALRGEGVAFYVDPGGNMQAGETLALDARTGSLRAGAAAAPFLRAKKIEVELVSPATATAPRTRLTYRLGMGERALGVVTEFDNATTQPLTIYRADVLRADHDASGLNDTRSAAWFDSHWKDATYSVAAPGERLLLITPDGVQMANGALSALFAAKAPGVGIVYESGGRASLKLAPGETRRFERMLFTESDVVAAKADAMSFETPGPLRAARSIQVLDAQGFPVPGARIELFRDGAYYGGTRTGPAGDARPMLPGDAFRAKISAPGYGAREIELPALDSAREPPAPVEVTLDAPSRLAFQITDQDEAAIPCKVQLFGFDGTPDPVLGADWGDGAVRNVVYSVNGKFVQALEPGNYEILISRGPEYDLFTTTITLAAGRTETIAGRLRRSVDTTGWIAADLDTRTTVSGDNLTGRVGRVLGLAAENIEFAPDMEIDAVRSYAEEIAAIGLEPWLATAPGTTLRTRAAGDDSLAIIPAGVVAAGAPEASAVPGDAAELARRARQLAGGAGSFVFAPRPDIERLFFDGDADGRADMGRPEVYSMLDALEIDPIEAALDLRSQVTLPFGTAPNRVFLWMQALNRGWRIPGIAASGAATNFHGAGGLRTYIKSAAATPNEIAAPALVDALKRGNAILTNGPFLEVRIGLASDFSRAGAFPENAAWPGDTLPAPDGQVVAYMRVQCPDWLDINRVQAVLNGEAPAALNWTRQTKADLFSDDTVRFEAAIPLTLRQDTWIVVVALGEGMRLGPIAGPRLEGRQPAALSNPVWVDFGGDGFRIGR